MKKMLTLLVTILLAVFCSRPKNFTIPETLAGDWNGIIEGVGLAFELHVGDSCRAYSPDQGDMALAAEIKKISDSAIRVKFPKVMASYEGTLQGDSLVGTFSQMGKKFPLTLRRGKTVRDRPQTPEPPFPYYTEDIVFESGSAILAGTLSLPDAAMKDLLAPAGGNAAKETPEAKPANAAKEMPDAKPANAAKGTPEAKPANAAKETPDATPVNAARTGCYETPVVLFVSGSGPQNRDEELMGHKPFAVLADAFARKGIASLRYDDRGTGASTGEFSSATTADFAADAAAGIRFLREQGFRKIGVVGHSEGGTIAFLLAGSPDFPEETRPDFIVSMAGMADRGDSTLFRQTLAMMKANGLPEAAAKLVARKATKEMQKQKPWGPYFLALDPAPAIAAIRCPVLALNGEKDTQVIPEYNLDKIKQLLPDADTRLYPGLNHLFQHCESGLATEYALISETLSPEVIADMTAWILER